MTGICSAATDEVAENTSETGMQTSNTAAETVTIHLLYMSNSLYYDAEGHSTGQPIDAIHVVTHVDAFYSNVTTGEDYGH
ncbi:hypothetical protein [Duganella sp. BuS-21]|uniref:hypothetical protein n=1 Tax=Duganella sp. BuS-21 TaxID=2943848 RepID=UPI0035A59E43